MGGGTVTLDEAGRNIGARVAYTGGRRPEYGVITRVNDVPYGFVFVRYADWGVKATRPSDLVFSVPGDAS